MKLIKGSPLETKELLSKLKAESNSIINTVYNICAYMRNISRDEAWSLTIKERNIIMSIIKSKIDTIEKTKGAVNIL